MALTVVKIAPQQPKRIWYWARFVNGTLRAFDNDEDRQEWILADPADRIEHHPRKKAHVEPYARRL